MKGQVVTGENAGNHSGIRTDAPMNKTRLELNEDESVFLYDALMLQLPLEEHKKLVNPESMSDYRADCLREIMLRIKEQWGEE